MTTRFYAPVLGALALTLGLAAAPAAWAHNGVKLEQDSCVFRIGPSTMHFSAYQRVGEEQEACDDIGDIGPTVIGLTAVSPDLRDMAIGLRVVKDVGAEQEKAGLDAITVANVPPKVYRNGVMTYEHDFKQPGHYVAIVTVSDDVGNQWTGRFPVSVGLYTFWGMIEYILYAVGFFALVGFLWFALRARASGKVEAQATQA